MNRKEHCKQTRSTKTRDPHNTSLLVKKLLPFKPSNWRFLPKYISWISNSSHHKNVISSLPPSSTGTQTFNSFNGFNPSRSLHQRRKYSHRTTHTSIHQRINRNTKDNNAESLYAKIKITLQVLYIAWCKNQCFFQNIPWSNLKVEQWIIYAWNGNNGSTIISKKCAFRKIICC